MDHQQSNFWISITVSSCFSLSHLVIVAVIAANDLSGRWDQYALCKTRKVSLRTYLQGLQNFGLDFVLFFVPLNLALVRYLDVASVAWSWRDLPFWIGKIAIGYACGKLWSYAVHYTLHVYPWLYRNVHKKHHVKVHEMVASHAWFDTVAEHLIMEVPNLFLPVLVAGRVHWAVLLCYFTFHGYSAAVDHSGFKINYFIDSEYHYYHHQYNLVNFAEMESIDLLFGTHHTQKADRKKPIDNQPSKAHEPVEESVEKEKPKETQKENEKPPLILGSPLLRKSGSFVLEQSFS